jgi:hypothetical protein
MAEEQDVEVEAEAEADPAALLGGRLQIPRSLSA